MNDTLTTTEPVSAATGEPLLPGADADLQTVLTAWHEATLRLEQTHETLQGEVCRLTNELEAKNRELARKNRLADLGQMAAHVAHEVRNNLVPVSLYLSLLRRRLQCDDQSLGVLEKVEAGFQSLDVTVNDLLQFTSDRDPQWRSFCAMELLAEVRDSLRPQLEAQAIETRIEAEGSPTLTADRDMIRRALLNLMLNAVDAMPDGGQLLLAADREGDAVQIQVADSGAGLDETVLGRVFEPFVTTKESGTGLGLAIVDRIAGAHGGMVTAENRADGGASFRLRFPQWRTEGEA